MSRHRYMADAMAEYYENDYDDDYDDYDEYDAVDEVHFPF